MIEVVYLQRDVTVVLIPDGTDFDLPEGTQVQITQHLGNNFTVMLPDGRKFRINGKDADALGKLIPDELAAEDGEPLEPEEAQARAMELLKQVHDPEIPVNIVELGLVYEVKMHKRGDGLLLAEVRMTLTAPGCGMGDVLIRDVEQILKTIPGVDSVDAKIVFDPVWNPYTMMSEAAKLQLGLL